jgi:hypothetical protein
LYAGAPVRRIKQRNAERILALEKQFRNSK